MVLIGRQRFTFAVVTLGRVSIDGRKNAPLRRRRISCCRSTTSPAALDVSARPAVLLAVNEIE